MKSSREWCWLLLGTLAGCSQSTGWQTATDSIDFADIETIEMDSLPPSLDGCSGHSCTGPHGGALVGLGREKYHGELVVSGDCVTVYILDSTGEDALAIDVPSIAINLLDQGQPKQFHLMASPTSEDINGGASQYQRVDSSLAQLLRSEPLEARLAIRVAGTAYQGTLTHLH